MTVAFDYDTAFARNLGWLTRSEQGALRTKRVAIAGLGGVGGLHLITLARLGVGRFHLAEFDTFDLVNFNRQVGASVSSLGQPKLDVMASMAKDINPTIELVSFADGVNEHNVDAFLDGVDLFVDGLDFFAFSARELVFGACARRNVPATTVAPLGMGAALLNFMPGKMRFAEYFGLDTCSDDEKPLRFLLGLAPAALHRGYLADPSFVDLAAGHGPSTAMACQMCAGVAATEALKILLVRGRVLAAPHGVHFDAYRNKLVRTWRPGGYRNPLQRALFAIAGRQFARMRSAAPRKSPTSRKFSILPAGRRAEITVSRGDSRFGPIVKFSFTATIRVRTVYTTWMGGRVNFHMALFLKRWPSRRRVSVAVRRCQSRVRMKAGILFTR